MKTIITLLIIISSPASAQLFNKTWKDRIKNDSTLHKDSVYLVYTKKFTTPDGPVYHYWNVNRRGTEEIPECRCINMAGKNIGDTVVISKALLDAMVYEASRMRKRKSSRKSDLEN